MDKLAALRSPANKPPSSTDSNSFSRNGQRQRQKASRHASSNPAPSRDPVIGQNGPRKMDETIPNEPDDGKRSRISDLPLFVKSKFAEKFFVPSIYALKMELNKRFDLLSMQFWCGSRRTVAMKAERLMKRILPRSVIATLSLLFIGTANANIRYDFLALSSYTFSGESFSGGFSLEVPDFITHDLGVRASLLITCDVIASSGRPASCRDQSFRIGYVPGYDNVAFGVDTASNTSLYIGYYFNSGDFGKLGIHTTTLFGTDQFATLEVTQTPTIPEPSTLSHLLTGLGLMIILRWRKCRLE